MESVTDLHTSGCEHTKAHIEIIHMPYIYTCTNMYLHTYMRILWNIVAWVLVAVWVVCIVWLRAMLFSRVVCAGVVFSAPGPSVPLSSATETAKWEMTSASQNSVCVVLCNGTYEMGYDHRPHQLGVAFSVASASSLSFLRTWRCDIGERHIPRDEPTQAWHHPSWNAVGLSVGVEWWRLLLGVLGVFVHGYCPLMNAVSLLITDITATQWIGCGCVLFNPRRAHTRTYTHGRQQHG